MRRRDFVSSGLIGAAAAALPTSAVTAAAAPAEDGAGFDAQLVRMRFKPDGKRQWIDWADELKRRRSEVVQTLRNEGVRSEACFLGKDGESLYLFMESADAAKAMAAFSASKLPIDAEHKRKLNACLEIVEAMTPLFSFQNDDLPQDRG